MTGLEGILREHPFLAGLPEPHLALLAGCARNVRFEAGQYLFRAAEEASEFFLIRHGRVALDLVATSHEPVVVATLGEGDIVGASWLVPPYRWMFDARAATLVRALGVNATCLREKCEADHHLGYELFKRFAPILVKRLQATRLQILNVYGGR
jgi:CRP/FNR family cyclic AMP-dependent transcriptional regulator